LLAARFGARRGLDQSLWNGRGAQPLAPHFTEVRALPGVEFARRLLGVREELTEPRVGRALVNDSA
jgi:hypothetical protein